MISPLFLSVFNSIRNQFLLLFNSNQFENQKTVPGANTLCDGAAACQVWKSPSGSFYFTASLGTLSSVRFSDTVNGIVMTAKGGTSALAQERNFVMTILCPSNGISEDDPRFLNLNEQTMTYSFGWNHKAACVSTSTGTTMSGGSSGDTNTSPGDNGAKLDDGWVMIILLIVFFVLYCAGGAMLMFTRGARNLEMIPNKAFWFELPALVKDGCKYTLSKIRREGYSNVK